MPTPKKKKVSNQKNTDYIAKTTPHYVPHHGYSNMSAGFQQTSEGKRFQKDLDRRRIMLRKAISGLRFSVASELIRALKDDMERSASIEFTPPKTR